MDQLKNLHLTTSVTIDDFSSQQKSKYPHFKDKISLLGIKGLKLDRFARELIVFHYFCDHFENYVREF